MNSEKIRSATTTKVANDNNDNDDTDGEISHLEYVLSRVQRKEASTHLSFDLTLDDIVDSITKELMSSAPGYDRIDARLFKRVPARLRTCCSLFTARVTKTVYQQNGALVTYPLFKNKGSRTSRKGTS